MTTARNLVFALVVQCIFVSAWVAVEIALRLVFPKSTPAAIQASADELAYAFNKEYLVSLRPDVSKTYVRLQENGCDEIQWRTNADGFRGAELRRNPGTRIIVYGDSNTQARFSHLEKTYVVRLAEHLTALGIDDVETINAGIIGFGPDQSLLRMQLKASSYQPDIVIFSIFADNDFGDIIRNRLFELDERGDLRETTFQRMPEEPRFAGYFSSLLTVRAILRLARSVRTSDPGARTEDPQLYLRSLQTATEEEFAACAAGSTRRHTVFGDHYDVDLALDPTLESSKTKARLMEAVLQRAHRFAATKGMLFLVVIQPSVIDLTQSNAILGYPFFKGGHVTGPRI
ncbi:MAG TPA: hypothetical protein QF650_00450 [Vicinamibacterales bacterium]|jgi:hypothetical protein|nr:hypothetical protein [Acidobacteriota bacterium]HJO37058.1 hypothetical protein [Vicinamibacterales bacterium]|tara:strand:- start:705 stop:1736 length:1032 start_codon:yes stop_codon:yes gene_type:complete